MPFRTFIQTFAVPENASETIPGVVWVTGSDIPEDLQTHYAAVVPTVAEITWTGFSGLYIYRLWAINGTVYNGWVDLDTFANPVVVEAQAIQNSYGASDTTTTIIGRDSTVDTIVAAASPTGAFYTGHGPNAASEPHRRRKLAASQHGISGVPAGANTTNAAFTDLDAPSSFTFQKQYDDTRVFLEAHTSLYANVAGGTACAIAMRINGVDYVVSQMLINPISQHTPFSGFAYVPAGVVPSGTYNVQARWRRISGAGTLTRDVNDFISIRAVEVEGTST